MTFNGNISYDYQLSVNTTGSSKSEAGLSRLVRSPLSYLVVDLLNKTFPDVIN